MSIPVKIMFSCSDFIPIIEDYSGYSSIKDRILISY